MKSFFDLRENKQITEAVKVSRKDFDKLKKGSMITIDYGSSVSRSNKRTFMVKGKSRSAKYNVDKVNMVDPQKPGGMKFHLYSRDGGDATLALGDMGATINSYSIKEAALKTSDYPKGTSMSAQKFKNSQKKMSKQRALSTKDYPKGTSMSATAWKNRQEEVELDEKTKWKMGDGRPRNAPRIENERFWNLPYDSLKYIAKDAGDAMKANPTARKATTGPGNWADQVADAATVMQWRKKNGIKESVELDEAIDFRKAFMDIQSYAKKNGGMDKTDFEKVAYYVKAIGDNQNTPNVANKAFMLMKKHIAGLDTDVRDGIHMLLKKHGMIKNGRIVQESIELDEGWRSGGGGYRDPFKAARRDAKYKELSHEYEDEKKLARLKQMRKTQQQKPVKKESVEEMFEEAMLNEFSDAQLAQLKKAYANLDRINVTSPTYKKLKAMIANMDDKALEKVARAKVRFVSQIAAREYEKKSGNRLKAKDYMESVDEASILRTKTTRKQTDASKEKDKKKAIKTFQDIKKGKYPGVKIGEYAK